MVIPIPKSEAVREEISNRVKQIVERRITAREEIVLLSEEIIEM